MEGPERKKGKDGEGGCKCQGVGGKEAGGNPRVWRLGGLGPVWATLAILETFLFCKFNLAINFFKNRDNRLD